MFCSQPLQKLLRESLGTDTTGYPGSEEVMLSFFFLKKTQVERRFADLQANVASDLLAAYQGGDEEVLKSVTDKQMFTFLDNEVRSFNKCSHQTMFYLGVDCKSSEKIET